MEKNKHYSLINSHTFRFNTNNENLTFEIETDIYYGKYGFPAVNVEQNIYFHPRYDCGAGTTLHLGMDYLKPDDLRKMANQLEEELKKAKTKILEKQNKEIDNL